MSHPTETRDAASAVCAALRSGEQVIAIDGRSGSGKTALAERLAATGGPAIRTIHLEDVYPGWFGLQLGCELAAPVLARVIAGQDAMLPTWDWEADRHGPLRHLEALRAHEVLVIEGCGALAEPLAQLGGFGIWCEADEDLRHSRVLARDPYDWSTLWSAWALQEDALVRWRAPDLTLLSAPPAGRPPEYPPP